MSKDEKVFGAFEQWYAGLHGMTRYGGRPAKGTVAASLIVLERLREDCNLSIRDHVAPGGAQIAGLSLGSLRKILARFDESRDFPSEGGRTNRGNNLPVEQLLAALDASGFASLDDKQRNQRIDAMQKFLVESLDAYYQLECIRFEFDQSKPVSGIVTGILEKATERNVSGAVAQHLVGAKLALRFQEEDISNFPTSAADKQAGRTGDFHIGDTAIHVTMAPTLGHAEKCEKNVLDGLRTMLLVPETKLRDARVLVETTKAKDQIDIGSIEAFVGQNVSEIATFRTSQLIETLGDLLREYNRRVDEVETDGSLLIEIPAALNQD